LVFAQSLSIIKVLTWIINKSTGDDAFHSSGLWPSMTLPDDVALVTRDTADSNMATARVERNTDAGV